MRWACRQNLRTRFLNSFPTSKGLSWGSVCKRVILSAFNLLISTFAEQSLVIFYPLLGTLSSSSLCSRVTLNLPGVEYLSFRRLERFSHTWAVLYLITIILPLLLSICLPRHHDAHARTFYFNGFSQLRASKDCHGGSSTGLPNHWPKLCLSMQRPRTKYYQESLDIGISNHISQVFYTSVQQKQQFTHLVTCPSSCLSCLSGNQVLGLSTEKLHPASDPATHWTIVNWFLQHHLRVFVLEWNHFR